MAKAAADPFDRIWCRGEVLPSEQFHLAPSDEGLLYGLGLFETTRTFALRPWLWDWHLERLSRSAATLGIRTATDDWPGPDDASAFAAGLGVGEIVLRLNITPGSAAGPPRSWLAARPIPPDDLEPGLAVLLRPGAVARTDPFASHKSFHYGVRRQASLDAARVGAAEVLLGSTDGFLLEAAHANVFVRLPEGWRTPALNGGVLPGTLRRWVLEHREQLPVEEADIPWDRLSEVRSAFLTNSVRGLRPVHRLGERLLERDDSVESLRAILRQEQENSGMARSR